MTDLPKWDQEEAEALVIRLREVLRARGVHPESCPKGVGIGYYKPPADAVCNCGIDAALSGSRGTPWRGQERE